MAARISILDYGMANLRSVQKAFEQVGFDADIIASPQQIEGAGHLVVPGVGAFQDAVAVIRERGLDDALRRHVAAGRPFLGICLGLQMLFDVGYEDGTHQGLGIIPGQCVRFTVDADQGLKVPHMGWNQLRRRRESPLLRGLPDDCNVYFVHSYQVRPADESVIATTTDYGGDFVSSIWRDNLVATQFHPEKSQKVGLTMLENFAKL
jgi:imidazole glycerol-phosphate synthase subunit HisH